MNERYRYGYGEDVPGRDSPLSGGSSVTDEREDDSVRADEEDEELRADRIREAAAESRTDATDTTDTTDTTETTEPADAEDAKDTGDTGDTEDTGDAPATATAGTTSDSVFDVEDDTVATGDGKETTPDTAETAEASEEEQKEEERAPIALGPPALEEDDEATTTDDLATATAGEPDTADTADTVDRAAASDGEPEPGWDAATETPVGSTADHETSIFEPATSTDPDSLANGSEPALAEGGTEAPVVATEEPPVVVPDAGAGAIAAGTSAAVTTDQAPERPAEGAPGTVEERTSLLGTIDPDETRTRFLDIQAGFVDEPRQAVHEAESFVDDLVQQLVRALETERANLKATLESGSTEDLRVALRGYRAFVDRLLNLR
jgi:hypothetical protein